MLRLLEQAVGHHRSRLNDLLPMRLGDIRYLSPGQIIFILTLYDVEVLRSSMDLPASLPTYFVNDGLNKSGALAGCMDAIAENVSHIIRPCLVLIMTSLYTGYQIVRWSA